MPNNVERNYYVLCEDNCRFPAMTKEQIINAIASATGVPPESIDVDAGFITKIKEQNADKNLKFWVGTKAQYNAITTKDSTTFYIVTDDDYDEPIEALRAEIEDLRTSIEGLSTSIETMASDLISGDIVVGNARQVNGLEIQRDTSDVLKIGNVVIPQLKKLWSNLTPKQVQGQNAVDIFTHSEALSRKLLIETSRATNAGHNFSVVDLVTPISTTPYVQYGDCRINARGYEVIGQAYGDPSNTIMSYYEDVVSLSDDWKTLKCKTARLRIKADGTIERLYDSGFYVYAVYEIID